MLLDQYGGERYREDVSFVSIPRILFFMALLNFLRVSKYACILMVVPRTM